MGAPVAFGRFTRGQFMLQTFPNAQSFAAFSTVRRECIELKGPATDIYATFQDFNPTDEAREIQKM
ncbi:MAG: hypothetical protein VX431_02860 [Planctomycetota bacterium]|nr:hypothetical protein [Planctomycetota bacterium]